MKLSAPGARTDYVYRWFALLSPALLLILSLLLLFLGMWQDSEAVATIGALGVIASAILPMMSGEFEFGLKGIRGKWREWHDLVRQEVQDKATARGFTPAEAADLARAVPEPDARDLARSFAEDFVDEALAHEAAVKKIVARVASEKQWLVEFDEYRGPRRFDAVIQHPSEPVLVEADLLLGKAGYFLPAMIAPVKRESGAQAAFIVVPDATSPTGVVGGYASDVQVLRLREFEDALRVVSLI